MHTFLSNLANRQTDREKTRANAFTSSFVGTKNHRSESRYLLNKWRYLNSNVGSWRPSSEHQNTSVLETLWNSIVVWVQSKTTELLHAYCIRYERFGVMSVSQIIDNHHHRHNAFIASTCYNVKIGCNASVSRKDNKLSYRKQIAR